MVDGISGIGANMSAEDVKQIVKATVEEVLEAQEAQNSNTTIQEIVDEESVIEEESNQDSTKTNDKNSENSFSGLSGLIGSITTMISTIMESTLEILNLNRRKETVAERLHRVLGNKKNEKESDTATIISTMISTIMDSILKMLGVEKNENESDTATDETDVENDTENNTYTLDEQEQAYLNYHPNYLIDLVAEEKYFEIYGERYDDKFSLWDPHQIQAKNRLMDIKDGITDADIQEYLQANPNVIKDAIAKDGFNY